MDWAVGYSLEAVAQWTGCGKRCGTVWLASPVGVPVLVAWLLLRCRSLWCDVQWVTVAVGLEWAPVAKRLSPGAPVGVAVSLHTAVGVTGLLCVCRSKAWESQGRVTCV